jgi:hypothetical protein
MHNIISLNEFNDFSNENTWIYQYSVYHISMLKVNVDIIYQYSIYHISMLTVNVDIIYQYSVYHLSLLTVKMNHFSLMSQKQQVWHEFMIPCTSWSGCLLTKWLPFFRNLFEKDSKLVDLEFWCSWSFRNNVTPGLFNAIHFILLFFLAQLHHFLFVTFMHVLSFFSFLLIVRLNR